MDVVTHEREKLKIDDNIEEGRKGEGGRDKSRGECTGSKEGGERKNRKVR